MYVGDVAVESTHHGSALLYRILESYPAERLCVIEAGGRVSRTAQRLPGVQYLELSTRAGRLCRSRISRFAESWLALRVAAYGRLLQPFADDFRPDAILSVAHGNSWLMASALAREAGIPLHLILHDYWPNTTNAFGWLEGWQRRQFVDAWRGAASRLCVSPQMEEECRRISGVAGQTLYPSRAKDCPALALNPGTYTRERGPLAGAYAGSIPHEEYGRKIVAVANSLKRCGGRLLLYGPHTPEQLKSWGLDLPNVFPQGMLPSGELLLRLQRDADFVFAPMAFDPTVSFNMRMGFPSKIPDYTATGLPLLIWGPSYCSAVRWAQEYGPVAEVVATQNPEDPDAAIARLEDRVHRESLGRAARAIGTQLFSHENCFSVFRSALSGGWRNEAG